MRIILSTPAQSLFKVAKPELLWIVPLLLFFAFTYLVPLASGASFSILSQIARMDPFFLNNPATKLEGVGFYDLSAFLINFPNDRLVLAALKSFTLPLWNPYQGCGVSFVGNIQSYPFGLIHFIAPMGREPLYSIRLVIQLLTSCLCIGFIGRQLRLSLLSKLFLSLVWATAPLSLNQFELLSASWPYPIVFCTMLFVFKRKDTKSLYFGAVISAFFVLCTHVEASFFGLGFGSLAACVLTKARDSSRSIGSIIARLTVLATATFLLSSFTLLPFVEWLNRGYLYKIDTPTPWSFNIYALITAFVSPICGSYGPTIGPCALVLLSIGWFDKKNRRITAAIWSVLALAIVIVCRPFPFHDILNSQPLVSIFPLYCLPALFLLAVVVAAIGLDAILETSIRAKVLISIIVIASVFSIIAPVLLDYLVSIKVMAQSGFDTDPALTASLTKIGMTYPSVKPDVSYWTESVKSESLSRLFAFIALSALSLISMLGLFSKKRVLLGLVVVAITVESHLLTPGWRLPPYPRYKPALPEIAKPLIDGGQRITSTGIMYFCPNLPSAFSVHDLRMFEAILPNRLVAFLSACGAEQKYTFMRFFDQWLDWKIDMASVQYILSSSDIYDSRILPLVIMTEKPIAPGITARLSEVRVRSDLSAVRTKIAFTLKQPTKRTLRGFVRLESLSAPCRVDSAVQEISLTDDSTMSTEIILPAKSVGAATVTLYVFEPAKPQAPAVPVLLSDAALALGEKSIDRRFELLQIDAMGRRLYRNNTANGTTYFASAVRFVADQDQAIKQVMALSADERLTAVIESKSSSTEAMERPAKTKGDEMKASEKTDSAKLTRISNNELKIDCNTSTTKWLVVTESYDPGWIATIDSQPALIYPANINFRALKVPAGSHVVKMVFRPIWFYIGLLLAGLTHLAFLLAILFEKPKQ